MERSSGTSSRCSECRRSAPSIAFKFQNGKVTTLQSFPSSLTWGAFSINNKGQIAGIPDADGDGSLLTRGRATDLGSLSGQGSVVNDLNEQGEVVGNSNVPVPGTTESLPQAFTWVNGRIKDLGALGGSSSDAQGVNNHGVVVGSFTIAGNDAINHPFVYKNGRMIDLGTLGGPDGFAHSINDKGVIVGSADVTSTSGLHAFIDQHGHMTDLNSLIPANSGFVLFRGLAINNSGQVVVEAYPSGTPVDPSGNPEGPFYLLELTPAGR